jgi:LacI family gluconate utilization system Gnt-I transcriptional repressor
VIDLRHTDEITLTSQVPGFRSGAAKTLKVIIERYPEADVAVFSSDIFASGAILAAPDLKVRIPADIAVLEFGVL